MKRANVRAVIVGLATVVVVSATVLGVTVATADSIKYESYQRASQTEVCAAQPGETPWQASWGSNSSWKPSWEQWANAGKGGWTCTRSITWAKNPVAGSSPVTYALGDIGPGGGLVFLISGGLTYEMAPNTWRGGSIDDTPTISWCSDTTSDITGAVGTDVGTGSANTTAMQSPACTSGAGVSARAYSGGGFSDWFLPSKDELNAMCNYSRTWVGSPPAPPTGPCTGAQDGTFASSTYGFAEAKYQTSSQAIPDNAWLQYLSDGFAINTNKGLTRRVRPIRAF